MDLKVIEGWTRGRLEAEAVRLGIVDGHQRTRGDLLRMILRKVSLGPLRRGRALLSKTLLNGVNFQENLKVASAVLPEALRPLLSGLTDLVDSLARSDSATRLTERAIESLSVTSVLEPVATQTAAVAEQQVEPGVPVTAVSVPSVPVTAVSVPSVPVTAVSVPSVPVTVVSVPSVPVTARVANDAAGGDERLPAVRRFASEPVRTLSMARLLANQGHQGRALAIYEELIARNTQDPVPRREAGIVREGGDLAGLPRPEATPALAEHASNGEDAVSWDVRTGPYARLNYVISEAGKRRAEAVLGSSGELTLRLVVIRPDAQNTVNSEVEEQSLLSQVGSCEVGPLDGQARCVVALGLLDGGEFVSIVHSPVPAN